MINAGHETPVVPAKAGTQRLLTNALWSRFMAPLAAAALGLVLLYGAGLAQVEELHNAAHDARHAAGFPCH